MSFLGSLKAERLITLIRTAGDASAPGTRKAIEQLGKLGPAAVPKLIEALDRADKKETVIYVELLADLLDNKTFPLYAKALADPNPRVVSGIGWAMSSSKNFNPSQLLDALRDPDVSKNAVLEVLGAHKSRLNARELLNHAYQQEPNEKAALFRLVGELADENLVPELISRIEGKDLSARVHIINILAQFPTDAVRHALEKTLNDRNTLVRQAAISALTRLDAKPNIELLCRLLRDEDLDVQNKAIDLVIKVNHPETIVYLVDVLKDESEYARRAGVEVLNEIGNAGSIKYLLDAIKDEDWWVRSRAADALAKIGGPRVVEAVIQLVKDDDEDIRRAAIEILNQTRDERAIRSLMEATGDKDWWVSERAVDALAAIGSTKAVPTLVRLLKEGNPRSHPTVIRALGKLGDYKILDSLLPMLNRDEKEVRIAVIEALPRLADERRAETVKHYLTAQAKGNDETIIRVVHSALEELDSRYSSTAIAASEHAAKLAEPAKTLLIDNREVADLVKSHADEPILDITTLKSGDIVEGRYKFIEKIGKGAFGTVLLMEDTVVDERLILKFLNPNVAADEEIMKRFVHELRYSRKITHKNVIRIYDFLYLGGHYAISMEYFPSHTLGAEIVNEKPLPLERALTYCSDVATGMMVAHQVGIVHRDLKPANILINDEGLVKIVDFGVAAAHSSGDTQLTKTGYVIGSPKYMAPEQILGKKVDERADIYSLGVILYEMLTGVPPYSRGDHMSVMYQHVQGKARTPRELNPTVPPELSDAVMRAMAVDKMKRFQSMEDLKATVDKLRH